MCSTEANKMEANQRNPVFDEDCEDDDKSVLEARSHEVAPPPKSDANSARKMCEDEGVDFDHILQAQKAITRIHAGAHQFDASESSKNQEGI